MAQPLHFDINGSIYFITTRLSQKTRLFTKDEAEIVKETISDLASEKK